MQFWKLALAGVGVLVASTVAAPFTADAGRRHVAVYSGPDYHNGYGAYGYNYTRERPYYRPSTFYRPYNYSYPRYWWYYTPSYSYYGYHPYRWKPYAYFDYSDGWRSNSHRYVKQVSHKRHHHPGPAKKLK